MTDPAALPPETRARLEELRRRIDDADAAWIERLVERAALTLEAATLKTGAGLPLLDPEREADLVARQRAVAGTRLPAAEFDEVAAAVRRLMRRVVGAS
jgi:chorismate mutase